MSTTVDQPAYLPIVVINAEHLADQVLADIRQGVAPPDALFMGLGGAGTEAGQRAYLRRVQKGLEAAHGQA